MHHERSNFNAHTLHSDKLLTVRDLAGYLGVAESTARSWVKAGTVPAIQYPSGGCKGVRHRWRVLGRVVRRILGIPPTRGEAHE
jgi:predicted site-specific integrase-resolvase